MRRILMLFGAVLVVAACDNTSTAPLKHDPKSANDECVWIKSGDSDSTLVCVDPK